MEGKQIIGKESLDDFVEDTPSERSNVVNGTYEGRMGVSKRMRKIAVVSSVVAAVALAACAPRTQYIPLPSSPDTTVGQYNRNVAECEAYARRQPGASPQRALEEGAGGAVALGLLGAVLGALAGDARLGGLAGASIGAVGGGVRGSQGAQQIYNMAFQDCMRNK